MTRQRRYPVDDTILIQATKSTWPARSIVNTYTFEDEHVTEVTRRLSIMHCMTLVKSTHCRFVRKARFSAFFQES